jgi:hypothetical protein
MDTNTHEHHTRSKADSQEFCSLADTERKVRCDTSPSRLGLAANEATETNTIDILDVAMKKANIYEISNSEQQQSEPDSQHQVTHRQTYTQQPNEIMLLLQQVLLKQDLLLGENKKLKHEMATQQCTIVWISSTSSNKTDAHSTPPK